MSPGRHTIARLLDRRVPSPSRPSTHPAGVRPSAPTKPVTTKAAASKKPLARKPVSKKTAKTPAAVHTPAIQAINPVLLAARTAPVAPAVTKTCAAPKRRRTPAPAAVALPAVLLWATTLGAAGIGTLDTREADVSSVQWAGELSARQRDALADDRASREAARVALAERLRREALARQEAARRAALARANRVVLPVSDYRLTARFGSGGGLWSNGHTGLDFATSSGSPVRAVKKGRVVEAGYDGSYGNKIVIRHDDGTETWYCHLSSMSVRGGTVAAGERIGRVGSTGNSTGPHLHLEVRIDDNPIDPYRWLRARGARP